MDDTYTWYVLLSVTENSKHSVNMSIAEIVVTNIIHRWFWRSYLHNDSQLPTYASWSYWIIDDVFSPVIASDWFFVQVKTCLWKKTWCKIRICWEIDHTNTYLFRDPPFWDVLYWCQQFPVITSEHILISSVGERRNKLECNFWP